MKKLKITRMRLALLIVILFVFGELSGIFAIRYLFLKYQMKEMEPRAMELAEDYTSGRLKKHLDNTLIKVYDLQGKPVDFSKMFDNSNGIRKYNDIDVTDVVLKYLPTISQNKKIAAIEHSDKLHGQTLIIGVPIVEEQQVTAVLFLLKPVIEYKAVLTGFIIVFSITLFLGLLLMATFFRQYQKQSQDLEQTRRDYVANISHELKSPIASIKALTETLYDGMAKEEETKNRYYGIILSETNRLEHLVMDMLELSKMQSKKMEFTKINVNAEDIIAPVCEKYYALCDDMGIEFTVTEEVKKLGKLYTNPERMTQLLIIYLDNAVKFVKDEGKICLGAKISGKHAVVYVKDNGIGIDKETLPHIFDRFYKEDKAHNTKGSGLGLAIASEIANGLNEKLDVKSELGKETTFSFTIQLSSRNG